MNIYKLNNDLKELESLYKFVEIEELDEQTKKDTLEAIKYLVENKATEVTEFITEIEIVENKLTEIINKYKQRKQQIQNRKQKIKDFLFEYMKSKGIKKIQNDVGGYISIRKTAPKVIIDDMEKITDEYKKFYFDINRKKISEDIKNGKLLDFAHLEKGETLSIK